MGFLDKVKEQGTALAAKAQEGVNQGQAKLNEAQANKKAAGLLEQLGAWQWAQRNGRDAGQAEEQIARVIGELEAHEAEHGPIAAPQPPAPPEAAAPPPPPAAGSDVAAPAPPPAATPPPPTTPPPPGAAAPPPPAAAPVPPTAPPAVAESVTPEGGSTPD